MIHNFATIDFETYYDKEYSLSKMQMDAYILDSQFEFIGVSIKVSDSADIEWFSGSEEEIKQYLTRRIDWTNTAVCCHHAHFDGFICTQRLGLRPLLWIDTLSMARVVMPWLDSHSLGAVAKELELGKKGDAVHTFLGRRLSSFTLAELKAYGDYSKNDVALTHLLAKLLIDKIPLQELYAIDMTIRMFTEPMLHGDIARLTEYYDAEVKRKEELLAAIEADKSIIMSNPKLAALLKDYGVTPPTKISKTTGKTTFAFAKTDKAFRDLLEHEDPRVRTVVAARLGVKSTIAETRAVRLIEAAQRGALPVYLSHWGAKVTGRHSGGNKMNYQNLPARGEGSELRKCLLAPPGHTVVVGDSSGVELRVVMACAGEVNTLKLIEEGGDPYCDFASKLYGRTITKKDERDRLVGKIAMLSLQYGSGPQRLQETLRIWANISISEDEAQFIVNTYREVFFRIPQLWKHCHNTVLRDIVNHQYFNAVDTNAWVLVMKDGFAIPGLPGVIYKDLCYSPQSYEWQYRMGKQQSKLYGGKIVENLCQHVARHIVTWQACLVHRKFPVALMVHDEIVCVVPDEKVEDCKAHMLRCLQTNPPWCKGQIPLTGTIGAAKTYGDAK